MTLSPTFGTFTADYADDPALAGLMGPGAPFETTEVIIDGHPVRAYANIPGTLIEIFEAMRAHDDTTHLVHEDNRLTVREVRAQAGALAARLARDFGVRRGDRVAIVMRNCPEFVTSWWASVVLGAVAVPMNSWWKGPELGSAITEAEPAVIIADAERVERLAALGELSVPIIGVRTDGGGHPGEVAFDALIHGDPLGGDDFAVVETDDVAAILYTSGTTGRPKGVVITHRGIITNVMNMGFMALRDVLISGRQSPPRSGQMAGIMVAPLFHIGGIAAIVGSAMGGSKTVLLPKWDVDDFIRRAHEEQVSGLGGVPAMAREFLEHPRAKEFNGLVASFTCGAANVPSELPRLVREVLGESVQIVNGYGLTETTSAMVSNVGDEYAAHPDSVGRLNPTADLRVEGPAGEPLGVGETGQLCFRSPQVATGYWRNPEATAESFVDGWFRSGDLGYVDDDGFVYVVDRVKDVIIRGGENVYCAEVEAVLYEHPAVLDVAAVGIPDRAMGERVCAVIVPRPGATPDLAELRAFADLRLATFKCPEALYLTSDMPRTATGKVAKKVLKTQVLADADGVVRAR
ncbi:class I adenylate-forming enzyme family protein [Gordonia hankookensis]|nr:class I adenylate-forming enzyme family protein [Gordonia hankookensis]